MNDSSSQTDRQALHQELLDAGKPELAAMALRLEASVSSGPETVPPIPDSLEEKIRQRYGKPEAAPARRREIVEDKPSFFAWLKNLVMTPGPAFAVAAACLVAAFLLLVPGGNDQDVMRGSGEEWAGAAPVVFLGVDPETVPGLNLETAEVAADAAGLEQRLASSVGHARLAVVPGEVRGYRKGETTPAVVVPYAGVAGLTDAIVEAEETLRAE